MQGGSEGDEVVVGLEIHQQLATKKLFCRCDSELTDTVHSEFWRKLRATKSELGELDRAALAEMEKKQKYKYEVAENSCLVEADEEPPHEPNKEALQIALTVALMMNATVVDEVHFMRKIVIDGSNTTGFQRTALIAMNGKIAVGSKVIGVPTICIEEDAARKIEVKDETITYRLDRLGIPLIEISTSPDIRSPQEAQLVAETIGMILRATKRVRRGIGTIREDINISVKGGARVEIKGVQDLSMIAKYIAGEVKRQKMLINLANELRKKAAAVDETIYNVTGIFENTHSKIVKKCLSDGGIVLAIRLLGFKGALANKLGPELAAHAKKAGAGGIFHSDELPRYGISEAEVARLREKLKLGSEDAFVILCSAESTGRKAMQRVVERAKYALVGVPEETRDPLPDGTTTYSRPLPGRARMYPETDIPPVFIDRTTLKSLEANLPEMPHQMIARLAKEYAISREEAEQIVRKGLENYFEEWAKKYNSAPIVARALLTAIPEAKRECASIDFKIIEEAIMAVSKGRFSKEAIIDVIVYAHKHGCDVAMAAEKLGLKSLSLEEAEKIIESVIRNKKALILSKRHAAFSPIMGEVMKRLRGKVDGAVVSEIVKKKINALLKSS